MRNPFKLSILAIALAMAGCSSQSKPVELGTVATQSQYDDQIQDGLGAQRYTEAQLLAQRQFNEFQGQLDELEAKRRELDAAINARAYENGAMEAPASSSEAGRIGDYQEASRASQQRVAEANSHLVLQQSRIENQRDQDLLSAEREASRRIAEAEDQERKAQAAAEADLREEIAGRQSIDAANRLQATREFEDQRFALAVANADAERQARSTLERESAELQRLQLEAAGRLSGHEARIAELRRQIDEIERTIIQVRASDGALLAGQESKVSAAQTEVDRLVSVGKQLRTTTLTASVAAVPSSDLVQMKQAELARLTSDADARLARRVAEIKSDLEAQKAGIVARARTDIASLSADAEKAKATVVAPVVTARAVYTGNPKPAPIRQPVVRAAPTKPLRDTAAPVLTVNRFEPQVKASPSVPTSDELGGDVLAVGAGVQPPAPSASAAPLVIAAKTRSVYDVFYAYKDESSWTKFQNYLKAYGITDFEATHNNAAGEFLIYCGRYYSEEEAGSRVSFLNSKTNTKHVQVRETQVPI